MARSAARLAARVVNNGGQVPAPRARAARPGFFGRMFNRVRRAFGGGKGGGSSSPS